jgi:hypothetical protein
LQAGSRPWSHLEDYPLAGTIIYPGLIFSAEWALRTTTNRGTRCWQRTYCWRGCWPYQLFAVPSLFTLTYSTARMAGVHQHLSAIWISMWIAISMIFYLREKQNIPLVPINHDLVAWSVNLHIGAMKALRLWYRSEWVANAAAFPRYIWITADGR